MNNRERFMAALQGEPADRVPVFPLLMFFTADRAGLPYHEYATNGRALAQAQLLIQQRFDLDAITVCSDAFRVSADLGGDMSYWCRWTRHAMSTRRTGNASKATSTRSHK